MLSSLGKKTIKSHDSIVWKEQKNVQGTFRKEMANFSWEISGSFAASFYRVSPSSRKATGQSMPVEGMKKGIYGRGSSKF